MNIASVKKGKKFRVFSFGVLATAILASSASAATSTAILNLGSTSAEGNKISIYDKTSKMTVANGGGDNYQLIGRAKEYIAILPDPIVHTSYARPGQEVVTSWTPNTTKHYATAYTEYGADSIWGSVQITD